jgi:hypothetical protein
VRGRKIVQQENVPIRTRKRPDQNCWEIAREMDDYRKAFGICKDCIVYMLKAENTVLSKQEIKAIVEQRSDCALA